VKKMLDSIFFTLVLVPRAQAPVIASEKTPPRISPRGAALASGMIVKSEESCRYKKFHFGMSACLSMLFSDSTLTGSCLKSGGLL